MAKSLNDLINDLTNFENAFKEALPKMVAVYANDAVALAIQRIEKEGAKEGARYSEDPMYVSPGVFNKKGAFKPIGKRPTVKEKGRFLNPGREENKTMYLEHGYKELRELQGLPTNVVNLEYSRRMLQNVRQLKTENISDFHIVAIVGATNEEEKKKLEGNFKRYGNFLGVTPEIAKVINLGPQEKVVELFKQFVNVKKK